ncbi:hypothetical protein EYR40_001603 [Pleurotus pulmonarius]|nr:hypothetical protein EYR36_000039 [Pleurotus pulmonarius]KAF4604423.1 hypothetical protein EYR38_004845 [Pleurotus pulmonarius]KAF4609250.1 hypothetical protein EYR40_001603 [Pleurotus pulmonarius]
MSLEEQYDTQIRNYREEIRRLGCRRNMDCSATKKLPSEILSAIFRELITAYRRGRGPRCLPVSHVCQVWRTVALNEPRLWSDLDGLSSGWLEECERRSKAAPLRIRYVRHSSISDDGDDEGNPLFALSNSSGSPWVGSTILSAKAQKVLDPLFGQPGRLGRLHIEACEDDLMSSLDAPAPYLSTLNVGRVDIPDGFLGGVAPRLQSVSIRVSRLSLGASWLDNVRHLSLCRWKTTGDDNASGIISSLGRLTQLEFLSMSFPESMTILGSVIDNVTLPSLESAQFCFSDSQLGLVGMFDYISCPNIRRLSINWPSGFNDIPVASKVGRFFSRNCDFTPELLRRGAWFDASRIELSSKEAERVPVYEDSDLPRLFFRNYRPRFVGDFLRNAFPGIQIRFYKLVTGGVVLEDLPDVEELSLCDIGPTFGLLLDESPPFPTLRRVRLEQISLRPKAQTFPKLKKWLKAQKRLEKLTIVKSYAFTEKDVQALQKIVKLVEVIQ